MAFDTLKSILLEITNQFSSPLCYKCTYYISINKKKYTKII